MIRRGNFFYLRCELPASLHWHDDHGDEGVGQGEVYNKIVDIRTRSIQLFLLTIKSYFNYFKSISSFKIYHTIYQYIIKVLVQIVNIIQVTDER